MLVRPSSLSYLVRQITDDAPPECVALEFSGAFFKTMMNVVIVLTYVAPETSIIRMRYENEFGMSHLEVVSQFCNAIRATGREVLLVGDFNAYTGNSAGFGGSEPELGDFRVTLQGRVTRCSQARSNAHGRSLINLCNENELCILNGLQYVKPPSVRATGTDGSVVFDPECTRFTGRAGRGGTVIDYACASGGLLETVKELRVILDPAHTDHNGVKLVWDAYAKAELSHEDSEVGKGLSGIRAWQFVGTVPAEFECRVERAITRHPLLPGLHNRLSNSGASAMLSDIQ